MKGSSESKTTQSSPTLKPLWLDWPEQRWPSANVLLEGPSILAFDPTELLLGPVIAVNHALATEAPVDFWATSDNPTNLWGWSLPHQRKFLRFFTTDQNVGAFIEKIGHRRIGRVYSVPFTTMGNDQGRPIILPTLIPLLSWLLSLGIKDVRLFGCDMWGKNSPLHSSELFGDEDAAHASRWKVERVLLSHAIRTYRAQGARIERWPRAPRCRRPSPSLTAPQARPTSS